MNDDKTISLTTLAPSKAAATQILDVVQRLNNLGLTATYFPQDETNPNCGVKVCEDDKAIATLVGVQDQLRYDDLAQLERIAELKYVELQLDTMRLRMSALGWKISIVNERIYIEKVKSGALDRECDATYENLATIEQDLDRTELRQAVLKYQAELRQARLRGYTVRLEDDGVYVCSPHETQKILYGSKNALAELQKWLSETFRSAQQ